MSEKQVYACHLTQNNTLDSFMNEDMAKRLKDYKLAVLPMSKDPMKYLATFIFKTDEERQRFYNDFHKQLDLEIEPNTAYVDEKYLDF